jgi:hypothetical protein
MFRPFLSVCLILLYLFEFPRGAEDSVRSVKDFINGTAIDFGLFLTFVGSIAFVRNRPVVVDRFVMALSLTLLTWGFFSALVGWFFYNGLTITVGSLTLLHNPVWGVRLHGVQGEPTHFGATVAIALLSLIYIYHRCSHGKIDYLLLCLSAFLGATLLASGSKNSIAALLAALLLMAVISPNKRRLFTVIVVALVLGPLFLVSDFSSLSMYQSSGQYDARDNKSSGQYDARDNKSSGEYDARDNKSSGQYDARDNKSSGEYDARDNSRSSRQYDVSKINACLRVNDDGSVGVRIRMIKKLFVSFVELPVRDKIFGLGYGALERNEMRSSFNSYLDMLVRFGVIHFLLVVSFLFYVAHRIFVNIRDNRVLSSSSIYAISLYVFSVVFSVSLSTWHSMFFHIANLGFIVAFMIASMITPVQEPALS